MSTTRAALILATFVLAVIAFVGTLSALSPDGGCYDELNQFAHAEVAR